jgi:hypothetical protein
VDQENPFIWVWIMTIGILTIMPGGVVCIACGSILSIVLAGVMEALVVTPAREAKFSFLLRGWKSGSTGRGQPSDIGIEIHPGLLYSSSNKSR